MSIRRRLLGCRLVLDDAFAQTRRRIVSMIRHKNGIRLMASIEREGDSLRPILVVEDNDEDYETTVRVLKKVGVEQVINRCCHGDDTLDYLFRRGSYSPPRSVPRPLLILLDLNMPGTDGFEVLAAIKQNDGLKTIPVIVLTTSVSQWDVERCYKAGANGYQQKSVGFDEFVVAIERFKTYWLNTAILP